MFSWPSQIISVCWLIVDCKSSITLTACERLFIHLQAIFFLLNLICIMEIMEIWLVHVWLVIRYCFKTLIWKLWWLISVLTCKIDYVIMPYNYVDTQHNYIYVKIRHKKYIYRLHVGMTVSHVDIDILHVNIIVLHAEERRMPPYYSRNKFIWHCRRI